MIVTQTPLRISFAGGGTDFRDFYKAAGHGSVVSSAIDKYIYVTIKERFDQLIRVGYTKTEMVETIDDVQHELVREAMRLVGVKRGVEITTMADIPSEGSGLGSSSTVTVGLLHALHLYKGELVTAEQLACEACQIEIDVLQHPIGKQDQYIAAYGGLQHFQFHSDEQVSVEPIHLSASALRGLNESILLFYTGITRQATNILSEQQDNIATRMHALTALRNQGDELAWQLKQGNVAELGSVLQRGWLRKKELASGITSTTIDAYCDIALMAGASGCKITGAGGGGFLLVYVSARKRKAVRKALDNLRELPIRLVCDGSKSILNMRR